MSVDIARGDRELGFLLAALRAHATQSERWTYDVGDRIDSAKLLSLAADHGLWGVLSSHWPEAGVASPEVEKARFVADTMMARNATRNREIKATITEIAEIFDAERIPVVCLKGAAFVAEAGDAAPWRLMADIDLLIDPTSIDRAVQLLLSHGYTATAEAERYRPADHQHYPPLLAPRFSHAVELHTRMVWDSRRNPVSAKAMLKDACPAREENPAVLVPSLPHRLVHLIAHAQMGDRNFAAGQVVLKDIADFAWFAHDSVDWNGLDRCFAEVGATPELHGFLAVAVAVLGEVAPDIPLELKDGQASARIAVDALHNPERGRRRVILHLLADYAKQMALNPSRLGLAVKTLIDPSRRADFLGTQYRRWRR